jgi:threonylcarbamoyladenosine tRNA methylthiotransferase MtaB
MSNRPKSTRVALDTLGCKLNQAETELLAKQLAAAGYHLVSPADRADVYILNTCTVTHIADRKARHRLRLAHHQNPTARLVATGCYAQRVPQELSHIEGVSFVVSNDEKPHLLRLLEESGYLSNPAQDLTTSPHNGSRTRSLIKVQDGCDSLCAYCIVPLVRGREKSLPIDQVVAEVKRRTSDGNKEVVLTGTKIGSYNYNGVKLKELVEHILAETNVTRLRLSSLQPQEISPELLGLWHDNRLCRHFHLALQSGSDGVLKRMKRRYSTDNYQQTASTIHPDSCIPLLTPPGN